MELMNKVRNCIRVWNVAIITKASKVWHFNTFRHWPVKNNSSGTYDTFASILSNREIIRDRFSSYHLHHHHHRQILVNIMQRRHEIKIDKISPLVTNAQRYDGLIKMYLASKVISWAKYIWYLCKDCFRMTNIN